jgi:predicted AAA+ superfamily ATPase
LITALQPESLDEVQKKSDVWGRWVEASIGAHLVNNQLSGGYNVHYWRHRNDEIDFVLERKGKVIGIEVKSGATQRAQGMAAFNKMYHPDKILLVGSSGLPWQELLRIPPSSLFQ